MKRVFPALLAALVVLSACSDSSTAPLAPPSPESSAPSLNHAMSGVARVTNNNNAGPGSFRQAIVEANGDASITKIGFSSRVGTIALVGQPVVFDGPQSLTIDGNRAVLNGAGLLAGGAAFRSNGGGNLIVSSLTFTRAPGTGLTVAIPATSTGTVKVSLINVTVSDNGSHGVLINDQAEYFNDPNSTDPNGSDASVDVLVAASRFERNGFTALDQDGLRINEGGVGNLRAVVTASRVEGSGGDGIEFDERAAGDVQCSVIGSALDRNGGFDASDFDDGIDIDESGDGSIVGIFLLTSARENFEQGFDLNENDAGDLRVDMTLVEAIDNAEEGIEYEEDDDFAGGGDIVATLTGIKTRGNGEADGDAGLKLREKGVGNLNAKLFGVESANNLVDGILLREDSDGNLSAQLQSITTLGNNGDGLELDENSAGNLDVVVKKATSSNNVLAGVRADQASPGTGTLQLVTFAATGNGLGAVVANAGVTVTQTP